MNFKKSTFIYLILILAALAAVIISGGCGGAAIITRAARAEATPTSRIITEARLPSGF